MLLFTDNLHVTTRFIFIYEYVYMKKATGAVKNSGDALYFLWDQSVAEHLGRCVTYMLKCVNKQTYFIYYSHMFHCVMCYV